MNGEKGGFAMKEKFNQFVEKCQQNKKKTVIGILAIFFLFIALGFGFYSLTTDNNPSQKVAEKEEAHNKKKVEQPQKKQLDVEKGSKLTTKNKEDSKEQKSEEAKKEEASKPTEGQKKTEIKETETSKPSTTIPQQKPVEPQKPVHTHNFQPVYTQKWIVDQPAWTETVETPVYETVERSICNQCGADITGSPWQHIENSLVNGGNCGGYHSEWHQIQTGTNTETINHPEQGHYENVISHSQCSCGATN